MPSPVPSRETAPKAADGAALGRLGEPRSGIVGRVNKAILELPRRPARGDERKVQILRTAAHVFLELGYDGTSMNVIAERAKVTKPGLYYHFASKHDLMFAIMSYAMDELERATAAARDTDDPGEGLRWLVRGHARLICEEADGALSILVIDETKVLDPAARADIDDRKREYYRKLERLLEALKAQGRLRDVDTTVAAFSILGMILWLTKWYREEGRLSSEEVVEQVTAMALNAVLDPESG